MVEAWKNDNTLQLVMEKIGDSYDLLDFLGGGGYARIYKVRNKPQDQIQALKIMDFEYILRLLIKEGITGIRQEFERISQRFMNEAGIYGKFSHPGIVKIYAVDFVFAPYEKEKIEIPYMILEYIEGTTLKQALKNDLPWDLKKIFNLCENVLPALDTIHNAGIIHRDIKPSNIMIRRKTGQSVLIDFGLARDIDNLITKTQEFMGTIAYASPEMLKNSKDISWETDLYSFGVLLYEMITGELPFTGSQADILYGHLNVVKSIPGEVFPQDHWFLDRINRIVKKAMTKEIDNRYRSAQEFLTDLKQLEQDLGDRLVLHKKIIKQELPTTKQISETFEPSDLLDQVLMDRYEIREIIGTGGRGYVYKVYDREDKVDKAVKVFHPATNTDPGALEQIRDEFEAARKLGHKNLVNLYSLEKQEPLHFIVMEYIDGINLEERLNAMPNSRLEEKEALVIMKQVLPVLVKSHQDRVLHHPLKPKNIMIKRDGEIKEIKMINFARKLQLNKIQEESNGMAPTGEELAYIPPEDHPTGWGKKILQADVWSFGAILYRLLIGTLPPLGQIQSQPGPFPGITAKTNRILMKCLRHDPGERYETLEEIYEELFIEQEPGPGTSEPPQKPGKPKKPGFFYALKLPFGKSKGNGT
jgi:serine/threonine protein kinase